MAGIASATNARATIETARMAALRTAIQRDQSAVSTGRSLAAGSDDPAAAARLDRIAAARTDSAAWANNLDLVASWAAQRDASLGEATAILDRARELVSAGLSGTASTEARIAGAAELAQLATTLRGLPANETLFAPGTSGTLTIPTGPTATVTLSVDLAATLPSPDLLDQAAAMLRIDDGAARAAAGATVIAALTSAANHVIEHRALTGSIANAAAAHNNGLTVQDIALAEEQAELGETDIAAAIARIQAHQLTLDAAQALFARINRSTLFDLLR
jgi:flagellar hook-associated protein 3 FlgL